MFSLNTAVSNIESVREFISYVNTTLDRPKFIRPIFSCICRRLTEERLPKSPNYVKGRHRSMNIVTSEDQQNGIFRREHKNNNVIMEASSIFNNNLDAYDVYHLMNNDDKIYNSNNEANSWFKASLKGNKSFIVREYMLRGISGSKTNYQLKSWKIEGQKKSDNSWILLDTHNEEPFDTYETRLFKVSCEEPLISIRLTQTSLNSGGDNQFILSGFDIFGEYEK